MASTGQGIEAKEVQNARALQVLARVKEKLTGRDFKSTAGSATGVSAATNLNTGMGTLAGYPNPNPNGNPNANGHHSIHNTKVEDGKVTAAGASTTAELTNAQVAGNGNANVKVIVAGVEELGVSDQVDKLLAQATSVENLCQHYIGWCSFW